MKMTKRYITVVRQNSIVVTFSSLVDSGSNCQWYDQYRTWITLRHV